MTEILVLALAVLPLALLYVAPRAPKKLPVRVEKTRHTGRIRPRR